MTTGIHSSSAEWATARTARPASAAPVPTAAATPRCDSKASSNPGRGSIPRLEQQPLEQKPRCRAGRAPCQPVAGEVRHAADPERVAGGHDQPLLTPPQVHQHGALVGERRPYERIVEAAGRGVAQMDRGSIRAAARELDEPGDAAARPRRDGDGVASRAHEQVERGIVAAGQAQRAVGGEPGARSCGAVGGDHTAGAVAPGDDAREAQRGIRARRRARRAAHLARQLPHGGQAIAGCAMALGDVLRQARCQLSGLRVYRYRKIQISERLLTDRALAQLS